MVERVNGWILWKSFNSEEITRRSNLDIKSVLDWHQDIKVNLI